MNVRTDVPFSKIARPSSGGVPVGSSTLVASSSPKPARAVATTENIDYVTSQSRPSVSTVTVQMKLGSNPDVALTEVLSKVQGVRGQLPDDAEDPVIVSAREAIHVTLSTSIAAALITVNWGRFIYAVNSDHVIESSLGYFITPLISAGFGVFVFRERLRSRQIAALVDVRVEVELGDVGEDEADDRVLERPAVEGAHESLAVVAGLDVGHWSSTCSAAQGRTSGRGGLSRPRWCGPRCWNLRSLNSPRSF